MNGTDEENITTLKGKLILEAEIQPWCPTPCVEFVDKAMFLKQLKKGRSAIRVLHASASLDVEHTISQALWNLNVEDGLRC